MRGWVRTAFYVGSMWIVMWIFGMLGYLDPMSFAVTLVGATGMALAMGTSLHACEKGRR